MPGEPGTPRVRVTTSLGHVGVHSLIAKVELHGSPIRMIRASSGARESRKTQGGNDAILSSFDVGGCLVFG
jgi:hypothetical protein